jgi:predicted DsbA family dithiol-disulfide isomerase
MKVEIWSDVVCPWCYIGKRRFETALAAFPQREQVQVIWRSYQLDPAAPRGSGESVSEMLARKYRISLARAAALHERVTAIAAQEGLTYHLERARYSNTFDAHRLIHLAADQGLQRAAVERLFRAYFTEGRAIDDHETLLQLAVEVGLEADAVRAMLQSDAYADAVRSDEQRAEALGITGVPFFLFEENYGISGAQPVEILREALERAWSEIAAPR